MWIVFGFVASVRSYGAADQNDLWRHLTKIAHQHRLLDNATDIKEIMDTWTLQIGFPEVIVSRNYTTNHVEFKQQKFSYAVDAHKQRLLDQTVENSLWWIPISYTTESILDFENTKPREWLKRTPSLTIPVDELSENEWILANIQQTGK